MGGRLLACLCVLGCGRVGFDTRTDDAAPAVIDAAFPTGPFGNVVPISELNTSAVDDDPSMTADGLELYFVSNRVTSDQLYVTRRTAIDAPWSAPVAVSVGGTANNAKVLPDGLTLYFSSTRTPNAGMTDVWYVTRPDRESAWGTPFPVPGLATAADEFEPSATPDQLAIMFTVESGATKADPVMAERSAIGEPFGNRRIITELMSSEYDGGYFLTNDRLLVLFHSNRGSSRDLFQATRSSVDEPFGAPVPLTELNTSAFDSDPWLSLDGHTMLFSRVVNGADDIFMATR